MALLVSLCTEFEMNSEREWGYRSSLPLERSIPASVLGQRRHAFSGGPEDESSVPYSSNPRMMRRGAVCYEKFDVTAQYIRFLGKLVPFFPFYASSDSYRNNF